MILWAVGKEGGRDVDLIIIIWKLKKVGRRNRRRPEEKGDQMDEFTYFALDKK